jgi:uncharacterized protein
MTNKNRKGSGKRIHFRTILVPLLSLAVLSTLLLFLIYLYPRPGSVEPPTPVYEEVYSTTPDLREGIRDIDFALYESLFRSGIREKDIVFLSVQPRHKNGSFWDFTELLIKCSRISTALHLKDTLERDLPASVPEVTLLSEEPVKDRILCHVFSKGFLTHRLILRFNMPPPLPKDVRPRIAIIIDDLGYDAAIARSFQKVDMPLSLSILPAAPFTRRIAREAGEMGREFMLHLPMEPKNYPSVRPGPGALFLSMGDEEIRETLARDLDEIPGVRGVNNHMGSSFTENRQKMLVVLKELKKRKLYYVDSRTSGKTVGFQLAREVGLPASQRGVFLDNDPQPRAVKMQMDRLMSMARHRGFAVGIGHPHGETLDVLEKCCHILKEEFQIVSISCLVE